MCYRVAQFGGFEVERGEGEVLERRCEAGGGDGESLGGHDEDMTEGCSWWGLDGSGFNDFWQLLDGGLAVVGVEAECLVL